MPRWLRLRVDLKLATRSCGNFLMKPTVSLIRIRGSTSGASARTVVSSVAKSLFRRTRRCPSARASARFAGIRIADERDAARLLTLRTAHAVFFLKRFELLFELGDAIADLAPIELEPRFTGAAPGLALFATR